MTKEFFQLLIEELFAKETGIQHIAAHFKTWVCFSCVLATWSLISSFLVSLFQSSGLFYEIQQGTQWFKTKKDNDETYGLVGLLLGLAVYNGVVLDLHFPRCVSVCLLDVWAEKFPGDQHQPSGSLKRNGIDDCCCFLRGRSTKNCWALRSMCRICMNCNRTWSRV